MKGDESFLTVIGILNALGALAFMRPTTPAQTVLGLFVGGVIGVAVIAVRIRYARRPPAQGQTVGAVATIAVGVGLVFLVVFSQLHVPWLPDAITAFGDFFTGGAFVTFIVAPFTIAVASVFHRWGGERAAARDAGGSPPRLP
jgi:hypothetical protein